MSSDPPPDGAAVQAAVQAAVHEGRPPLVIGTPVARFEPRPPRSRTYRPDTAVDGWSSGHFAVRGASVRGYQHRHDGTPRQDDFAITWHAPTDALIVAVADGVSDAELAHVGATLACRTAVEQLLRRLDDDPEGEPDWPDVLRCASWALVDFADGQPGGPDGPDGAAAGAAERAERLLATTLVAAVLRPGGDGPATVTAARAGDSTAWLLRGREWTELFGTGEDPDVLTTSVTALPRLSAEVATATVELPADGVLLVGTDGVGVPVGSGRGPVGTALAAGVESPPTPLDFGYLLDFSRETFDDDRTLVAVWPLGEPGPP